MDCLFSHIIYGKKTHEQISSITCEHTHTHTHTHTHARTHANSPYHQLSPNISFATRDHHISDPSSKPDMTFPASPLTFLLPHTARQEPGAPPCLPQALAEQTQHSVMSLFAFYLSLFLQYAVVKFWSSKHVNFL
ncbi:hypothetical protein XENOCAPTIV_020672 [Xenoophorus captivus]|uniref:Uncharacterized protein n=1 Tax=Xenoophorus captivus TaxID=1517983 RepID=A0ABV0RRQ7_9TELE